MDIIGISSHDDMYRVRSWCDGDQTLRFRRLLVPSGMKLMLGFLDRDSAIIFAASSLLI